jgi:hypothetical protein
MLKQYADECIFRANLHGSAHRNVKLILDVRDNGGEDELGRVLFSYFAGQPFRYYRDLVVNKLSFDFFQYVPGRGRYRPSSRNGQAGADGKYHVVGHPNWGMQQPAAPPRAQVVIERWQLFHDASFIHAAQLWQCNFR